MESYREKLEEREQTTLSPYATLSAASKGRRIKIPEHDYRTVFQRDIDRIIHSKAFRRLEYKTQVYVNHEGDHYRTRLTHTIEVFQISTAIARALALNEDLTQAIALAHDLGHTPFGHSGEAALNEILQKENLGGFQHNIHGVKVVEKLEKKYASYEGLNLSWEVREGILKHTQVKRSVYPELLPQQPATLEGQVVAIADEIAQDSHDLDDGLRGNLLKIEKLQKLSIYQKLSLDAHLLPLELTSTLINFLVTDVIKTTLEKLEQHLPREKIKIEFSQSVKEAERELREFLTEELYNNYRIKRMDNKAREFIKKLYQSYRRDPLQLPDEVLERFYKLKGIKHLRLLPPEELAKLQHDKALIEVITDYIAGMTDRFVQEEYKRLFLPFEIV